MIPQQHLCKSNHMSQGCSWCRRIPLQHQFQNSIVLVGILCRCCYPILQIQKIYHWYNFYTLPVNYLLVVLYQVFLVDKMDRHHNVLSRLAKLCCWHNTPMDTFCNSLSFVNQNTNRMHIGYNLLTYPCTYLHVWNQRNQESDNFNYNKQHHRPWQQQQEDTYRDHNRRTE